MPVTSGYVAIDQGRLYYEVAGTGAPVILNHGFSLDTRMWDDQFETLARHYTVIRYDSLGFGRSSVPIGPYRPVDDQAELIDHLGIAQAHILGLSRGGGIAIDFALAYPHRTLSLILADSTLNGYAWRTLGEDTGDVWSLAKKASLEVVKARWLGSPLFAPAMEQPTVAARLRTILDDYSGWHWVNRDQGQATHPPAVQRLSEITASTLIILGERDLADFHAVADLLAAQIPRSRKVILPGVGHMSNMEAPDLFNQTVLDFLASVR